MKTSPTQRTLAYCRKLGGIAAVVEKWNAHIGARQDLWGFCDVIHVRGDHVTWIQTTSGDNVAARVAKIRQNPNAAYLRAEGHNIEVHGWRKVGPRGKRKTWQVRVVSVGRVEVVL